MLAAVKGIVKGNTVVIDDEDIMTEQRLLLLC